MYFVYIVIQTAALESGNLATGYLKVVGHLHNAKFTLARPRDTGIVLQARPFFLNTHQRHAKRPARLTPEESWLVEPKSTVDN